MNSAKALTYMEKKTNAEISILESYIESYKHLTNIGAFSNKQQMMADVNAKEASSKLIEKINLLNKIQNKLNYV